LAAACRWAGALVALVGVCGGLLLGCTGWWGKKAQRGLFPAAEEQTLGLELVWPLPLNWKHPVTDVYRLPGTLCVVSKDNTFTAIDPQKGYPLWTQYLDDDVRLRATEAGDKLYLPLGARLLTIDRATGGAEERRLGFVVSSPPALDTLYVYLGSADGRLRALPLGPSSPQIGWQQTVGGSVRGRPQAVLAGVYFAAVDGFVYAANVADGSRKWEFKTDGPVVADLVLRGNVLYVASRDTHLYALDTALGASRKQQQRWLVPYSSGDDLQSAPLVSDDVIFVVGERSGVHALRASDGTGMWQCPQADSFLAAGKERVVLGARGRELLCVDRETGKLLWQKRLPGGAKYLFVANGEDDLIYLCRQRDGALFCYRAQ
jgi:outer membrane protein assembly factor BamB